MAFLLLLKEIQFLSWDFPFIVMCPSLCVISPFCRLLLSFHYLLFHISVTWWSFTNPRTHLSILSDIKNAVVCVVLILPLLSNSSGLFSTSLVTVTSVLARIALISSCSTAFTSLWHNPSICTPFSFLFLLLLSHFTWLTNSFLCTYPSVAILLGIIDFQFDIFYPYTI